MFSIFRHLHAWATRDPVLLYVDPALGELKLDEVWWECTVPSKAGPIQLAIGGHNVPDEKLLERGRETARNIDVFIDRVTEFLKEEAPKWGPLAEEVQQLSIDNINHVWPRKPDRGMIYFRGPDELHGWHCDFDGARFFGLTFDT